MTGKPDLRDWLPVFGNSFPSVLCSTLDLKSGFNLVGFSCPANGYSAYKFLNDLESENVLSVQRSSADKGAFETAGFVQNGQDKKLPGRFFYSTEELVLPWHIDYFYNTARDTISKQRAVGLVVVLYLIYCRISHNENCCRIVDRSAEI